MRREQSPVTFENSVIFKQLPKKFIGVAKPGDVTPSVKNVSYLSYAGSVDIIWTNLTLGADGQVLHVIGNSKVTLANNSNIKTNVGFNKTLRDGRIYTFFFIDNIWVESAEPNRDFLYIKDFGAKGIGTGHDDTPNFQAAVDQAIADEINIIMLDSDQGGYYVPGTVVINPSGSGSFFGLTLMGQGQRRSQIFTGNNATAITFSISVATGDYKNGGGHDAYNGTGPFVRFKGFNLQGPNGGNTATATSSVGIEDWKSGSSILEDIWISKYGQGYAGIAADIQSWRDNLITFCGIGAACYSRTDQIDIHAPYFGENDIGLLIESSHVRIWGGQFVAHTTADIVIQQPATTSIPPTSVVTTPGSEPDSRTEMGIRVIGTWFESFAGITTPRHIWLGRNGAAGRFSRDIYITACKFICAQTTVCVEIDAASDVTIENCDVPNGSVISGSFIKINAIGGLNQYVYDNNNRLPSGITREAGTLGFYQSSQKQVSGNIINQVKNGGTAAVWNTQGNGGIRWAHDGISLISIQRNNGTEAAPSFATSIRLNFKQVEPGVNVLTWGANIALQANAGGLHTLNATSNIAATISVPTSVPTSGQTARITIIMKNSSGGAIGTALAFAGGAGGFKLVGGAFTNPANGFSRGITFVYHQADNFWYEESRWSADA